MSKSYWQTYRKTTAEAFITVMAVSIPCIALCIRLDGGIYLHQDSLSYIHAAQSLLSNGFLAELSQNTDAPLTRWPPLYPLIIAVISKLTGSLEVSAIFVSLLSMFTGCLLSYNLFSLRGCRLSAALLTMAIFLNPTFEIIYLYALSEGIYIAITLGILFLFLKDDLTPSPWIIGSLVGLGFLTRYLGIALIPVMITGYLIKSDRKSQFPNLSISMTFAFLIITTWILRNYLSDGTALGYRPPGDGFSIYPVKRFFWTIGDYLAPNWLANYHGRIGFGFFTMALIYLSTTKNQYFPLSFSSILTCVFIASHVLLLIYSQVTTALEPLNVRLLSPTVVPFGYLLISVMAREKSTKSIYALPAACFMIFLYYGYEQVTYQIKRINLEFKFDSYDISQLPHNCAANQGYIFSNQPSYLAFKGLHGVYKVPEWAGTSLDSESEKRLEIVRKIKHGKACLVWFSGDTEGPPKLFDLIGATDPNTEMDLVSDVNHVYTYQLSYKGL